MLVWLGLGAAVTLTLTAVWLLYRTRQREAEMLEASSGRGAEQRAAESKSEAEATEVAASSSFDVQIDTDDPVSSADEEGSEPGILAGSVRPAADPQSDSPPASEPLADDSIASPSTKLEAALFGDIAPLPGEETDPNAVVTDEPAPTPPALSRSPGPPPPPPPPIRSQRPPKIPVPTTPSRRPPKPSSAPPVEVSDSPPPEDEARAAGGDIQTYRPQDRETASEEPQARAAEEEAEEEHANEPRLPSRAEPFEGMKKPSRRGSQADFATEEIASAVARSQERERRERRAVASDPTEIRSDPLGGSTKGILLVEDSATMRTVVERTFSAEPYVVVAVDRGEEAVPMATQLVPAIALVDVSLPDEDGYEIAAQLKANPRTQDMPVILLYGVDGPDATKLETCGAAAAIQKPFETEALIDQVRKLTRADEETE